VLRLVSEWRLRGKGDEPGQLRRAAPQEQGLQHIRARQKSSPSRCNDTSRTQIKYLAWHRASVSGFPGFLMDGRDRSGIRWARERWTNLAAHLRQTGSAFER
jgi:hypothetical protein